MGNRMRTRQTLRKPITLPGRYFNGLGDPENVMLTDVSTGGCRFKKGDRKVTLGAPVQIFVAGTGPHRAIIKWIEGGDVGLSFVVPLTDAQLNEFQPSHIPDADDGAGTAEFEDMGGLKPQRFC